MKFHIFSLFIFLQNRKSPEDHMTFGTLMQDYDFKD